MIKLLVSLLLHFPQLAEVFFKVRDEYTKHHKNRNLSDANKRIDEWVRGDSKK
jgi:hypothetical protein